MDTLHTVVAPDFLLRDALHTSLLVGAVCPLVGVFLVLRRLIFMGVALPQISATGVAVALLIPVWLGMSGKSLHNEHLLAFAGATAFAVIAILALALSERRGLPEGRIGTAYAVATAASFLLLAKNGQAELGWLDLLKGEVVAICHADLVMTASVFAVVLAMLWLFHKEFLLVSFDRTLAFTLRRQVLFWDLFLYLLIGVTISTAVLSVGPLMAFGFLVIPVLAVQAFATTMRQLCLGASLLGGAAAFLGFCLAYHFDLPIGPAIVALLGTAYAAASLIRFSLHAARRWHNGWKCGLARSREESAVNSPK
jgi:ABC-type Mn2+/Zn2+ transport system permease subunit